MHHGKAINVKRRAQRLLQRPGYIGVYILLCLTLLLSMPIVARASEHVLWLAGKEEVWKLDEQLATLELIIQEVGQAKAAALDDQRDILWILTRDGRIKSYGFDGSPHLDIPIPLESVQQMLHYKALVEEYESKIQDLFASHHQWMRDHEKAFKEWEEQHREAYRKWLKEHPDATRKEKREHERQYQNEREAKHEEYHRQKREKEEAFREELENLKDQLSEYRKRYWHYFFIANRERHEIERHDVGLVVNKQDGSLWIGSHIGLLKISVAGQLLLANTDVGSISDVSFDIKEKKLWAAGRRELLYLNGNAEVIRQVVLDDSGRIFDIEFDQQLGELWVARGEEGLLRYDREGTQTHSNNLRAEEIAPDGTGNLWVSSKQLLKRITPAGELLQDIELEQEWYEINTIVADVNTNYLWVLGEQAVLEEQYVLRMEWVWVEPPYPWFDPQNSHPPYSHHQHHEHGHGGMWWPVYWWEVITVKHPGDRVLGRYDVNGTLQLSQLTELQKMRKLAVSGDIYKPTAELLAPIDDGLVTPLQTFRLQVSDQGWGVDPTATQIIVENTSIELNCTIDADIVECTPISPITALEPVIKISIQDYADNRSDIIEVAVKLDTDNDGHPDIADTYPDDPDRWQLAQVENLQVHLNGTALALTWDAHSDQQNLDHYDLYRTGVDGIDPIKLNDDPIEVLSYIDSEVSNGAGYQYRVVAVDHKGVPGEEAELTPFFVAYNYTPVTGLSAVRQGADGLVRWDRLDGFRYQVYRGLESGTPEPLAQVNSETFLDGGVKWYNVYKYQVATIADFIDPFTQQPLTVIGPRSAATLLPALPPLSMSIDDAVAGDQGVYELVINTPDRITLTGQYLEAIGPVSVNVSTMDGSQQVTTESSSGRFQLVIPVITDMDWTVIVSETTVEERSVELKFRLIEDTTPPELTMDGPLQRSIDADTILLSGTAIDRHSAVSAVTVISDRFPGVSFGVILGANGTFSSEVPLERGDNHVTVQAADMMDNRSSVELTIKRTISLAPEVLIQSPAQGDVFYDPKITLAGVVYSSLDPNSIRIVFGDRQIFPTAGVEEGVYHFAFENVTLQTGYNQLVVRAETTVGNSEASVSVQYQENPPDPETTLPPELEITSPNLETTVNQSSITITGIVSGSEGTILTINGEPVHLVGEGATGGSFKYQLNFSECNGAVTTLTFVVTDSTGKTTTKTVSFVCDAMAPVITLSTEGLNDAPAVNRVIDNPFVLEGIVSDANLGGFSINGSPIELTPGTVAGTYYFSSALQLPKQQNVNVILEAWDLATNHTSKALVLNAESPITIELLSPRQDAELLSGTSGSEIEVIARIGRLEAGYQVTMALDDETAQPMSLDEAMASGILVTTETTGQHTVTVSVLDGDGAIQTSTSVVISLTDLSQLPLVVDRHSPLNAEKNAKPNSFIALYFNRPIDPDKLQVDVRQTVHAETYDLEKQKANDFGDIPKPSIIEVHLDMEPVAGTMAYYPTDRYVTFHPVERLNYGAYILVEVLYDGEELKRFAFNVEPQPTTVAGIVVDQLRTPLQGIALSLPELGIEAVTDTNGNYIFQLRGDVTRTMNDGRYRLIVNPGMKNPQFGMTDNWVNLQAQRLNSVSTQIVPMLNQSIPFQHISGGNAETVLARGNLTLDLGEANLLFPDGTGQGNVHVQLLQGGQLSFPSAGAIAPAWMYGVQPSGIVADGDIGISILMPRLDGNRDYIPPNGTLVAMLGFNSEAKLIEVIGIGEVMDQKVITVGKIPLQRLDYIGYAMLGEESQQVMQRYRDGEIGSLDILRSELESAEE